MGGAYCGPVHIIPPTHDVHCCVRCACVRTPPSPSWQKAEASDNGMTRPLVKIRNNDKPVASGGRDHRDDRLSIHGGTFLRISRTHTCRSQRVGQCARGGCVCTCERTHARTSPLGAPLHPVEWPTDPSRNPRAPSRPRSSRAPFHPLRSHAPARVPHCRTTRSPSSHVADRIPPSTLAHFHATRAHAPVLISP